MNRNILLRYLIRQNLFYLGIVFASGISIYLLIELFDRLDDFLKAGVGTGSILLYFLAKIPLIISQIFPAVFLLSLLIQFSLMHRNREIVALQASAVSFIHLSRIILGYAMILSCLLFAFSQILATKGFRVADRIWKEEVHKKQVSNQTLRNIWFREGRSLVRLKSFQPFQGKGEGIVVYTLSDNGDILEQIIQGQAVRVHDGVWHVQQADVFIPQKFSRELKPVVELHFSTDPQKFVALKNDKTSEYISFWELSDVVQGLDKAGSNVEGLLTALYSKISYPCSLLIMALVAMALTSALPNIYGCVVTGLLLIFVYYTLFVIGSAAGENGVLPPFVAAWTANSVFGVFFGGMFIVSYFRQR